MTRNELAEILKRLDDIEQRLAALEHPHRRWPPGPNPWPLPDRIPCPNRPRIVWQEGGPP
jgi:hypothetical protein